MMTEGLKDGITERQNDGQAENSITLVNVNVDLLVFMRIADTS